MRLAKKLTLAIISLIISICALQSQARTVIVTTGAKTSSGGTPTFKALVSGTDAGSTYTVSTSTGLDIASNDLLVVFTVRYRFEDDENFTEVTCGAGNTLTKIKEHHDTTEHWYVAMWAKEGATAASSQTCTATNLNAYASTYNQIYAANYSGVTTSSAADVSSCNSASCNAKASTATDWTAQDVTTTNANDLLIFFAHSWNNTSVTFTASGAWNRRSAGSGIGWTWLDKNITSTGSHPNGTVVTAGTTDLYISLFGAFKAAP